MAAVSRVELQLETGNAEQKLSRVQKAAQATQGAFGRLAKAGSTLQGALVGIGAGALVKGFVSAGIEASRTEKRLKLLAGQYGEAGRLAKFAQTAADKFALGNTAAASAVTDLYGRLRPMGVSLQDIQTTFLGVNNAAAKMNLSAADTEGVMLQLSQALGSGKLQGDEFRSIMERLPAIGQAVAKSMGVEVAQLKELSSQGKLTTDVIIKALGDLSKQEPPPPDAYKEFQKSLADLGTVIGTQILPALTPLVKALAGFASFVGDLPGPLKTLVAGAIALGGGLAIIAPLLGPIVSLFGALAGVFAGGGIFATIAGYLGAVVPVITAIGSALSAVTPVLIGLFTGPVGWVALLAAAGAAIYAFRDQIGQAFQAIGKFIADAAAAYKSIFIDPLIQLGQQVIDFYVNTWVGIFEFIKQPFMQAWQFIQENFITPIQSAMPQLLDHIRTGWSKMREILSSPFVSAVEIIKSALNGIMSRIEYGVNGAISVLNNLISQANRIPGVNIPFVSPVSLPRFAEGGVVTGPTLAMVGEGGENEFIIPQSKAAGFAANYLSGKRGASAIPGFADGGYVASSANVNIQTGPVTQMNGTNYVTTQEMGKAVQAGVQQTLDMIRRNNYVRTQLGLA